MTVYPEIKLKPIEGKSFRVVQDCIVYPFRVIIKAGTVTDLTSSPRWLWWLIPPHGATKQASIVHDCMIRRWSFNRNYADSVYLFLLLESVPKWQAFLMYFSIQIFKKQRRKHENAVILD